MLVRTPLLVAKRTLVLASLSFRAGLEVTEHPQVVELTKRIPRWLEEIDVADDIDPIEREELATPRGALSASQMVDCRMAARSAGFFLWALHQSNASPFADVWDVGTIQERVPVLTPQALAILDQPVLRDESELAMVCVRLALLRARLQQFNLSDSFPDKRLAETVIWKFGTEQLERVGLVASDDDLDFVARAARDTVPLERGRISAFCFVVGHAAQWLFAPRPTYFEPSVESDDLGSDG